MIISELSGSLLLKLNAIILQRTRLYIFLALEVLGSSWNLLTTYTRVYIPPKRPLTGLAGVDPRQQHICRLGFRFRAEGLSY